MPGNFITILSHNAGWFQGWPYAPETPGHPVPEVVESLAGIYARLEPDLICLQEIQSQGAFDVVQRTLGLDGTYCPGVGYGVYGGGAFWQNGLPETDAALKGSRVQRFWQTVLVPVHNGASMRVCNLHLSSSRHVSETDAAKSRIDDLREILRCRRPHIIVGDFNEGPAGGPSELLARENYIDTALLVTDIPVSTGVNKSRSDQIWIAEVLEPGFHNFGFVGWPELTYAAAGKDTLSDHLPLWIRLDANALCKCVGHIE